MTYLNTKLWFIIYRRHRKLRKLSTDVVLLLNINILLKQTALRKMTYFSKIHCPTSFQDCTASNISTATSSQVHESTMPLFPVAGNSKLRRWGGIKWHNGHTKIREDRSTGSSAGIATQAYNEKA
jgi:hypothetical protein